MKIEDIKNDEAPDTTEAAEELAADYEPYTDEERAVMSPEQRAEVERIEQAIEEFLSRTQRYMQTDKNRKAILGFLDGHDLRITSTSLLLAFEELSEAGELELKDEQPDESEEQEEESAKPLDKDAAPTPTPQSPQKKHVVGWRNGKEIEVGG